MVLASTETFDVQVGGYRKELLLHCYRMLGTIDEAEDAVQETLTRAWQGRHTYRRDVSLRAWLYRIATNVCLNAVKARSRGVVEPGPCPDHLLEGASPAEVGPDARYDSHESVSLAFLTVLQVLPARQRAVLLLRDVLSFRASEVGDLLDMTVAGVNSALQRARATLVNRYASAAPKRSADPHLLERYVRAWEAADVASLVALLREDAVLSMPPQPMVVGARAIVEFLVGTIFPMGPMRLIRSRANAGPALAAYVRPPSADRFGRFALLVLDVSDDRVVRIHAFADPRVLARFDLPLEVAG